MSRSAGRAGAALAMIVPTVHVALRRARRTRRPSTGAVTVEIDGRSVELPDGPGPVRIDGQVVGDADVRHDHGTSTVEAWMQVTAETAPLVVCAVEGRAEGVRRVAWLVEPDTAEASALESAGYERESTWAPPLVRVAVPHELWARVTTPPTAQ